MDFDKLNSSDYENDDEEEEEIIDDQEEESEPAEETMTPTKRKCLETRVYGEPTPTFEEFRRVTEGHVEENGDLVIEIIDIEKCMEMLPVDDYDDPQVSARREQDREDLFGDCKKRSYCNYNYSPRVPCIRIYGKNIVGESVCVNCFGYYPKVRARCPGHALYQSMVDAIEDELDAFLRIDKYQNVGKTRVIMQTKVVMGYPAFPYVEKPQEFLEFTLGNYGAIRKFSDLLWRGGSNMTLRTGDVVTLEPYSCHDIVDQFQADFGIKGFGWIRIEAGQHTPTTFDDYNFCAQEFDATVRGITTIQSEDAIVPLRKITFDIECIKQSGFPDPTMDPVVCISCILGEYEHGQPAQKTKVLLTYGEGDRDERVDQQINFKTEQGLLQAFGELVKVYDPDYLCGHNAIGFDIPYVVQRSSVLGATQGMWLGRRSSSRFTLPREVIKKRKNGEQKRTKVTLTPGRIQLDTMVWIMNGFQKERRYSLAYLSQKYLQASKDDVPPPMIWTLYHGTNKGRGKLYHYCMKDSILTEGLVDLDNYQMVIGSIEMSRVTHVPCNKLLCSGVQVKVWELLLLAANHPQFDDEDNRVFFPYEESVERAKDDKYQGATVLNPYRGFYRGRVVLCGDYQSLYPSIIMGRNICYSTEVINDGSDYAHLRTSPSGTTFVDQSARIGLLPKIERELMDARAYAKKKEAAETNKGKKSMWHKRQNEIKVVCNSVYGVMAASGGRLPRMELAKAVTSYGRSMIDAAKNIAETQIVDQSKTPGESLHVIYGDTDSIFILASPGLATTPKAAFDLLKVICNKVTQHFAPSPVKLQAEKIMYNLIMINKKRYIAAKMEGPDEKPKLLVKGVETARRDNCMMVVDCMNALMDNIVLKGIKEKDKALEPLNNTIKNLLAGKIPMDKLVISKAVTKENYKIRPPHIAVIEKMRRLDPSYSGGGLGDRVPYVVCANGGKNVTEKAEDPLYAINEQIPIDTKYYLDKQLAGPVARILMWIYSDKDDRSAIRAIEEAMHATKTAEEEEKQHKKLVKAIETMMEHTKKDFFGGGALRKFPKHDTASKTRKWAIDRFFTVIRKCKTCGTEIKDGGICQRCFPMETCPTCGLKHLIGSLCSNCNFHCSICGAVSETPICTLCSQHKCGWCGVENTELVDGKCPRCVSKHSIMERLKLSPESCVDIEDLLDRAVEAKLKCDECRAFSDENGISCRQKDCANLFLRANLNIDIRNSKNKL